MPKVLANCSFQAPFGMQHLRDIRKFLQVRDLCQPSSCQLHSHSSQRNLHSFCNS